MDYFDMGYSKKFYKILQSIHKIKSKEICIYKQNEHTPLNKNTREDSLIQNSICAITNLSVPFVLWTEILSGDLDKTKFFSFGYSWSAVQKRLLKKCTALITEYKSKFGRISEELL